MIGYVTAVLIALAAPGNGDADSSSHVLQDPQYDFCHDGEYPMYDSERDWCELAPEDDWPCPELRAACEAGVRPADFDQGGESGQAKRSRRPRGADGKKDRQKQGGDESCNNPTASPGSGSRGKSGSGSGRRGNRSEADGQQSGRGRSSGDGTGQGREGKGKDGAPGTGAGEGPRRVPSGDGAGEGRDGKGKDGQSGARGAKGQRGDGPGKGARSSSERKNSQRVRRDRRQPQQKKAKAPPPASGLAQLAFFVLVALGLAALGWVIFRNAFWTGRDDDEDVDLAEAEAPAAKEPRKPRVIETDVQRLLDRARAAAREGQHEQAIELAYAAVLRSLEHAGHLDMHSSATNGDYVRALAGQPELGRALHTVVGQVERVQFGATRADAPLFEKMMQWVMPIVGRVSTLVLIVAGTLLLGCENRPPDDGYVPGLGDATPSGTRAVVAHLNQHGIKAAHRLKGLERIESDVGALIVLPGTQAEQGWQPVLDWVREGGTLVLAGELPDSDAWDLELVGGVSNEPRLLAVGELSSLQDFVIRLPLGDALVAHPSELHFRPALEWLGAGDEAPYAVAARFDDGLVLAFADELLFSNVSLAVADNDRALVSLLEDKAKVHFCDDWTGSASGSPLDSVRRARLTAIIAQVLVLLLLLFLLKGVAFGRLRDPVTRSRRSFVDHVRAVGLQYARAGAAEHAAGVYASWALERLRERVPRGRHYSLDELAAALAPRVGRPPEELARVLHHAQAAGDVWGPSTLRPDSLREAAPAPAGGTAAPLQLVRELTNLLAAAGRGRTPE